MRKIFILMLFLSISLYSIDLGHNDKINIFIKYTGETLTHPGFSIGLEYEFSNFSDVICFSGIDIGFYNHFRNHSSISLNTKLGAKHRWDTGFIGDVFTGIGIMKKKLDGDYYILENDKLVNKNKWATKLKFPIFGISGGYIFKDSSYKPIITRITPSAFFEYPFNGYFLPHYMLQLDIGI